MFPCLCPLLEEALFLENDKSIFGENSHRKKPFFFCYPFLALCKVCYTNCFFFSEWVSSKNVCILLSSELLTGYSLPFEIIWQMWKIVSVCSSNFWIVSGAQFLKTARSTLIASYTTVSNIIFASLPVEICFQPLPVVVF